MARDPDLNNRGHIDPGEPRHNHDEMAVCGLDCPMHDLGVTNRDPINAWHPGSVEQQRAHFRPLPKPESAWISEVMYGAPDEMMPKAKPEREGPDYANGIEENQEADDSLWLRLSYSADLIPPRTMWILQNVVPMALRRFIRHNLEYRDTDMELGLKGQFTEIHHITAKLRRLIWKSNPQFIHVSDVQTELENLIGHALLALDLLDKGNHDGK